ncbi:MAG TPA: HAMP domain-containing sensor histidine kinase [Flavobacteriales bacterium]
MPRVRHRTPLLLFGLVALYIVLQSLWWAWLLLQRNGDIQRLQHQLVQEGAVPEVAMRPLTQTHWMVVGEGAVFLLLLLLALWLTYRTLRHELALARQQRDFLLATSHELRTPIAGLKLHLQTLRRPGLDEAQRTALASSAIDDLDRLGGLTEKILLATRLDEAQHAVEVDTFDANAELRDLCLRASLGYGRGHRIEGPPAAQAPLTTDLSAFRSVVVNLLENACKYAPPSTLIHVSLERTAHGTVLQVTDQGPGVPPAERERIFEKFYRSGSEETRGTKGTGLGLYIVARLMRRLGGRIEHREAAPHGSIFAATFPHR